MPPSASVVGGRVPWMEELEARLATRAHTRGPVAVPGQTRRRAAVLVPLYVREGSLWVVLTRRTETVEHHPGQISFPGGAEELEDETLLRTALRETEEEIGISADDVRVLGSLSPLTTVTDFYVEPFVGAIPYPYVFRPAEAEIASVVEVPVAALREPGALETRALPGRDEPVLFYHHGPHIIWGATGRMLKEVLDALG